MGKISSGRDIGAELLANMHRWPDICVQNGLVRRIASGHVNLIQGGRLVGAFNLVSHPLFFIIPDHVRVSFLSVNLYQNAIFIKYT